MADLERERLRRALITRFEIEAPEYLEEGVNFYDQPPFNEIYQATTERTGFSIESIRRGIQFLCDEADARDQDDEITSDVIEKPFDPDFINTAFIGINTSGKLYRFTKISKLPQLKYTEARNAFQPTLASLTEYPYWRAYISNGRKYGGLYTPSGDVINHVKKGRNSRLPTYAKFASDRLRADNLLEKVELEEILPDGYTGRAQPPGGHLTRIRWQLLRGSEIIGERRRTGSLHLPPEGIPGNIAAEGDVYIPNNTEPSNPKEDH